MRTKQGMKTEAWIKHYVKSKVKAHLTQMPV